MGHAGWGEPPDLAGETVAALHEILTVSGEGIVSAAVADCWFSSVGTGGILTQGSLCGPQPP